MDTRSRLGIGCAALVGLGLVALLWLSFGRTTEVDPAPVLVLTPPPEAPGAPVVEPVRIAANEAAPPVDPEVDAWITRHRALAAEALEHCALDELTMACEGATCAFRMAHDRDTQLRRRPLLFVELLLVLGLGFPETISPCARAASALPPQQPGWVSPPRYVAVKGDDPAHCYAIAATEEGADRAAAVRLCTRLAEEAGYDAGYE